MLSQNFIMLATNCYVCRKLEVSMIHLVCGRSEDFHIASETYYSKWSHVMLYKCIMLTTNDCYVCRKSKVSDTFNVDLIIHNEITFQLRVGDKSWTAASNVHV